MVSRRMISVWIAVEIWRWLVLGTAGPFSSFVSVPLGVAVASELLPAEAAPTNTEGVVLGVTNRTATTESRPRRPFLLGVMVDAGRHEFSVGWIETFMEAIHELGLNALHLTLASDQRFAFATNHTHTQQRQGDAAANKSPPLDAVFSKENLHTLARRARSLNNLTILPEVSLPFFAASWDGMALEGEGDVLAAPPCPRYICSDSRGLPVSGTNLPLDVRHPNTSGIVRTVLQTLVEGLEQPEYLHLGISNGASSQKQQHGCWEEVLSANHEAPPDYEGFGKTLARIVADDLGYRPRIVRSLGDDDERTVPTETLRANPNTVLQYKDHQRAAQATQAAGSQHSYLLQPTELNLATTLLKDHPTGWAVYTQTMNILNAHKRQYEEGLFAGMIISTEALSPSWFRERNVLGRLLAISMAVKSFEASVSAHPKQKTFSGNILPFGAYADQAAFDKAYKLLCDDVFPKGNSKSNSDVCHRLGGLHTDPSSLPSGATALNRNLEDPHIRKLLQEQTLLEHNYKKDYAKMWKGWAEDICYRLTETRSELKLQVPASTTVDSIRKEAFSAYWRRENEDDSSPHEGTKADEKETFRDSLLVNEAFRHTNVPFRGFIVDLVDENVSPENLYHLMENVMVPLGLNTLQLSLINHLGCSLQLESLEGLYHRVPKPPKSIEPLSDEILMQISDAGERLGIDIIPEISVTTQATGWYHAGFLVDCPETLCSADASSAGGGIPNNVNHGSLLPLVLGVIRRLRAIFRSASFLHLGSDERSASLACWKESDMVPQYDRFEVALSQLLETKKWYNASSILRWENEEGIVYPHRTGRITQYRYERDLAATAGEPVERHNQTGNHVFGSLSVTPEEDPWTIYRKARRWASGVEGIPPKGVMARIRLENLETHPHHVWASILAFAIGLSSNAPVLNDRSSLDAYVAEICAGESSGLCISPSTERGAGRRAQPFVPPRGPMLCRAMTGTVSRPVMRSQTRAALSLVFGNPKRDD